MTEENQTTEEIKDNTDTQSSTNDQEVETNEENDSTILTEESKEGEKETQKAPDEYEEFKAIDGIELDEGMMTKFKEVAKSSNLNQENAQQMVNLVAEHIKNQEDQRAQELYNMRETWVEDIRNDSEFGGANFKGTVERAQRVLKEFGSTELNNFLSQSGFGDNNELVKMLARIGKSIGEDNLVDGNTSKGEKTAAEVLYGSN